MSLINDVLRNLDARNAAEMERASVPRDVRPLPSGDSSSWRNPRWLAVAATIAVALMATAWLYDMPAPASQHAVGAIDAKTPDAPPAAQMIGGSANATAETATPAAALSPPNETGAVSPRLYFEMALANPPTAQPAPSSAVEIAPAQIHGVAPSEAIQQKPTAQVSVKPADKPPREVAKSTAKENTSRPEPAIPSSPNAEWDRLREQLARGDINANTALTSYLVAHPEHVEARQAAVELLLRTGQLAEAERVLRDGLALQPGQSPWRMHLARIRAERNDYAGALLILDQGQSYATNNADYLAFHATVLQRLGRSADAVPRFEAALRLKPQEARWWAGYGIVLDALGKQEAARDAYLRARQLGGLPPEVAQYLADRLR